MIEESSWSISIYFTVSCTVMSYLVTNASCSDSVLKSLTVIRNLKIRELQQAAWLDSKGKS
jgi:hypothetical protein